MSLLVYTYSKEKVLFKGLTKSSESGFTWEIVEALFGFDGIDLYPRNIAPQKQN